MTQATVSRDIRDLKLTKVPAENGRQKYAVLQSAQNGMTEKYVRILRDGFSSMDMAQNILVLKTVSGMAMAVAAALDAMNWNEIVGCIAGDDTIMCAVRTVDDTILLMEKIKKLLEQSTGERMLQNLHVKNLALIDEAEVDFSGGLNILTGKPVPENQLSWGVSVLPWAEDIQQICFVREPIRDL